MYTYVSGSNAAVSGLAVGDTIVGVDGEVVLGQDPTGVVRKIAGIYKSQVSLAC